MKRISSALAGALLTTVLATTGVGAASAVGELAPPLDDDAGDATDSAQPQDDADRPSAEELENGGAEMGWSLEQEQQNQPRTYSSQTAQAPAGVPGIDVSNYQPDLNWQQQWNAGIRFAYIKATEGDYYESPVFNEQYSGSYDQGMIRGAYHFGNPDVDTAAGQARFFVDNGGGWSSDGQTLPGVLDIEYDPYGDDDKCYGQSAGQLVNWIEEFVDTYEQLTGRAAVIYSNGNWWRDCTNNSTAFAGENPLWFARWNTEPGPLPGGWTDYTFWQYTDTPFDHDVFNGSLPQLREFAQECPPAGAESPTFCDVPPNHVFAEEISWLAGEGITTGYDDGNFHPSRRITREAMAAFIYRYSGEPDFKAPSKSPFSDVAPADPFYREIAWLAEQGITTGYDDGTFRPKSKISREAMAAFLYRFEDVSGDPIESQEFSDVPPDYVFAEEISWLASEGITTGYDDGTFRPDNKISREATAAFLYRLHQG